MRGSLLTREKASTARDVVWRLIGADLPPILWLLTFGALIKYMAMFVSPFAGLYLTDTFDASLRQIGWVLAAHAVGSLLGFPLAGLAIDRFGSIRVIMVAAASEGLCLLGLGFATGIWQFAGLFLICGALAAAFRPAFQNILTVVCTVQDRPRAYALSNLAWNLSSGLALVMGGVVYTMAPRHIFVADTILDLLAMMIFAVVLIAPAGKIYRVAAIQASDSKNRRGHHAQLRSPWREPFFLAICACLFLVECVRSQSISTFPLYVTRTYGLTPEQFGIVLATGCFALAAFIMPVTTALASWDRHRVAALGAFIMCSAYALCPFGAGMEWAGLVIVVSAAGQMLVHPALLTLAVAAAPAERRGAYLGVYYASASIAWSAGPALGANLYATIGSDFLWLSCIVPGLLVAYMTSRLRLIEKSRGLAKYPQQEVI